MLTWAATARPTLASLRWPDRWILTRVAKPPVERAARRAGTSLETEPSHDRKVVRGGLVAPSARILRDRRRLPRAGVDVLDALHESMADENMVEARRGRGRVQARPGPSWQTRCDIRAPPPPRLRTEASSNAPPCVR